MNKFRNALFMLSMAALVIGCAKGKAKNTLVGDWTVIDYEINDENLCSGQQEYNWGSTGDLGEVTFTKKDFTASINLYDSWYDSTCYVSPFPASGDFKVTSHDRQLLLLHEYQMEVDGDRWYLYFDEGLNKADGSNDIVTISSYDSFVSTGVGTYFSMTLQRN